jgi:hypothetical protein
MVEQLEHAIRQAADHPRHSRGGLYRELLRSETFLLTLDAPIKEDSITRVTRGDETFPIWADKDPELGGVWVPIFPARDSVAKFVSDRRLKAPKGKEFLWMGHKPGAIFGLLRNVKCFAGIRLFLEDGSFVPMPWSDVKALSEGRVPDERPEVYDLPIAKLVLPAGSKLAFGLVDAGPEDHRAKLLCLPEAGHFRADDVRKLVKLPLTGVGTAWMACRHFLQVLRYVRSNGAPMTTAYVEDLMSSMIGFQMFGEAEALCEWLEAKGRETFAWMALASIYAREGKLSDCAAVCARGAEKYPEETSFAASGARALHRLGRVEEARAVLAEALKVRPDDERLVKAREDLSL